METFNEFLESKYAELDNDSNNMNEASEGRRDHWFSNLDVQELIDFGEKYGKYVAKETALNIINEIGKKYN